ncbi:MAG: hypothetical protein ACREO4_10590 [Lysobacter sp.]
MAATLTGVVEQIALQRVAARQPGPGRRDAGMQDQPRQHPAQTTA